jgi:hypothetical protein
VSKPGVVALFLIIELLVAVIVAQATFGIMRADKATVRAALIRAAIAFAGTLTLLAVIFGAFHAMLT